MPDSDLKVEIATIGEKVSNLSSAVELNTSAQTELLKSMNSLIGDMRVSNVESKQRHSELAKVKDTLDVYLPSMHRTKLEQESKDKLSLVVKSTWVKYGAIAILVIICAGLGVSPKEWFAF